MQDCRSCVCPTDSTGQELPQSLQPYVGLYSQHASYDGMQAVSCYFLNNGAGLSDETSHVIRSTFTVPPCPPFHLACRTFDQALLQTGSHTALWTITKEMLM